MQNTKILLKKLLYITIIITITLTIVSCKSINTQLEQKNDYYHEVYEIDETKLKLIQLDFDSLLNYEEIIPDEKYIILFLRDSCAYSKDLFSQFIKHYNDNDYNFDRIYIFEVDNYVVSNDKEKTEKNREKFVDKFDIQSVPATLLIKNKKIFSTEIGYYPENILVEILTEFERK